MHLKKLLSIVLVFMVLTGGVLLIARQGNLTNETTGRVNALHNMLAPAGQAIVSSGEGSETLREVVEPVTSIPLRDMPVGEYSRQADQFLRWQNGEVDLEFDGIPPALRPLLLEEAMNLPAGQFNPAVGPGPILLDSWDSLDSNECCGGGTNVPPDPEMAAGPDHVIAVVNVALEIYDKDGTSLVGPVTYTSFFSALGADCSSGAFDPNVLYDEEHDRFFIGVDGNGNSYCVAVSATNDPTGAYYLYNFTSVDVGGTFFDYPHAGVGDDAIYMGANLFGSGQGYAYALDKVAMYNNQAATIVIRQLNAGFHTTPQPYNAHGWAQGTWPTGPHYFFAGTGFGNASTYQLYSWDDPFGANNFQHVTSFNLPAIHGVPVGSPINAQQQGGAGITGNDPRPLDFEYRNGSAWTAMTVSCNPGGGTVNCIQWAEVDLTTQTIAQTDVFATNGEFRYFPDFAVDSCGNAMVGYTRSSASSWPSVWTAGPVNAGANPAETLVKAGETVYSAFANRWGDYSGMTIDPDGTTFWYLGEYSKNNGNGLANWGDYIGELTLGCLPGQPSINLNKTVGTNPAECATTDEITVAPGTEVTYCYEVTNTGAVTLTLHDLVDDELGTLLNDFPYSLAPGSSVAVTESAVINTTTVNSATWTAFNPGPSDTASDTDSATVNVDVSPAILVSPTSLTANQVPGVTTMQTLDIENVGGSNLDWMIEEEAASPLLPSTFSVEPATNQVTIGDGFGSFSASGSGEGAIAEPVRGETPEGMVTITHSTSQSIFQFNSVSCNAGGLHTDNSYIRRFNLSDFGITSGFDVVEVEIGIEAADGAGGTQPATINLYTWDPGDPFTFANFNLIGAANTTIADQDLSIVTVPVAGTAPAGSTLVVEFFTPDGQTAGNSLFVGSNSQGQTSPTYLAAAGCGVPQPTDTAAIGYPDMHLVMNVTGDVQGASACDMATDIPWLSVNPSAGTTLPGMTSEVDVTFDSTGLSTGTYTAVLCIDSNDPNMPNVDVPVTLNVGMDLPPVLYLPIVLNQ